MESSILPSSLVYVKYLSKAKFDSYMFAVLKYDKENETISKLVKPYNNNEYIYIKEKVLNKMKKNQPELEDYLNSEKEMVLKLYFNKYNRGDKVVEYVDYVQHKKAHKYKKELESILEESKKEFIKSLADRVSYEYPESESE